MRDPCLSLYAVDLRIERCLDAGAFEKIPPLARARATFVDKIRDLEPGAEEILRKIMACEKRCQEKAERKRNEIAKALMEGMNELVRLRAYRSMLGTASLEVSHANG